MVVFIKKNGEKLVKIYTKLHYLKKCSGDYVNTGP